MTRRSFVVFAVFAYGIFGLGLLVVPAAFMNPYGVGLDADGALVARVFGAALAATALVFWWVRAEASSGALLAILRANCLFNIAAVPIQVVAIGAGTMNALGWTPVFLHAVLAAGLGYYGFVRAAAAPAG